VLISSRALQPVLAAYRRANVRALHVVLHAGGLVVQGLASIVPKRSSKSGPPALYLYPLGELQKLLRALYLQQRDSAPRRARRPLPVVVLALAPAPEGRQGGRLAGE
jgi:hypothetical protein